MIDIKLLDLLCTILHLLTFVNEIDYYKTELYVKFNKMKVNIFLFYSILLLFANGIYGQAIENYIQFENKHYVGSQVFMVLTPLLDPSPEYFQINYGYRFSPKDEISIEAITWAYQGPLGRPYGPDYENADSNYPGDVKSLGAGLAYKRLLWKGAYVHLHSTAFRQTYRDHNMKKIQTGFMLFNTVRLGYHFKIFKKRWFIAPSIGATFWPVYTNLPDSFQIEEDKWSNYFLGELGLHFGYTF